jgi:hypothetical protein
MIEGDNVCYDEVSLKPWTEASKERNGLPDADLGAPTNVRYRE